MATKKPADTKLHIGKIIRTRLEEIGMTKSEFARRTDTSPQNIYGIFKRESCDSELLRKISVVLNYNFSAFYDPFAVIEGNAADGSALPRTPQAMMKEIEELKKTNAELLREKELRDELCALQKESITRLQNDLKEKGTKK
jgi:hypothetical protein